MRKLNLNNLLIQHLKPKSFIAAPLSVRGKVLGVLVADRQAQEATITEVDKEFVVSFANQIAIALGNAILYHKLEVTEQRYRELVENAHEGIWILDENCQIKFANRRMKEITGYENLEGKNVFDLVDWHNSKMLTGVLNCNRQGDVAQQELENEAWLRQVADLGGRSYEAMRVIVLEFLDTDNFHVSREDCVSFLDPLIESWDIDLATFALEIVLNDRLVSRNVKKFEFNELASGQHAVEEPGLKEFLRDSSLSGTATPEEVAFLKRLTFTTRRPTPLYYYRELQNLRDPLHFSHPGE